MTANTNTSNRWDTRTLVTMALLAAIGAALSFIEVPFIAVQFLKYDASNVPALIGGFVFGPVPGFIIGVISAIVHGIFTGNWGGCIMNIVAVGAAVIPSALIYRRKKTMTSGVIGLIVGAILATIAMILMNLLIDPIFYGYTYAQVMALVVPVLLPFNIIKTIINSILCLLIYKPISNIVHPKRKLAAVDEDEE